MRPECQCANILRKPKNFPKPIVCDNCYKNLPKGETPSKDVTDLCFICDCKKTPEDECCKPKCSEVYKNPFVDLKVFDECCLANPA